MKIFKFKVILQFLSFKISKHRDDKKFWNKSIFLVIFISVFWSIGNGLVGIFFVIIDNFLEDGLKLIVDLVELRSLGKMDDQSWLQFDVAVNFCIFLGLDSFCLQPSYCDILVFEQALGYKTHCQVRLIINSVELNGVKLMFEEMLHLDDYRLKCLILSNDNHIMTPWILLIVNPVFLGIRWWNSFISLHFRFLWDTLVSFAHFERDWVLEKFYF